LDHAWPTSVSSTASDTDYVNVRGLMPSYMQTWATGFA